MYRRDCARFIEREPGVLEGGNAPKRMSGEIALRRPFSHEDVNRLQFIFDVFFNQTQPDYPDINAVVGAEDAGACRSSFHSSTAAAPVGIIVTWNA